MVLKLRDSETIWLKWRRSEIKVLQTEKVILTRVEESRACHSQGLLIWESQVLKRVNLYQKSFMGPLGTPKPALSPLLRLLKEQYVELFQ